MTNPRWRPTVDVGLELMKGFSCCKHVYNYIYYLGWQGIIRMVSF